MILHAVIWTALSAPAIEPRAFESVLQMLGYQTTRAQRPGTGLLVIPSTTVLSPKEAAQVRDFIRNGGDAVIAGVVSVEAVLGVPASGAQIAVKDVTELSHAERYLRWNPTATVNRFDLPPDSQSLMQDQQTHQPLAFFGTLGRGRYLALAAPFDTTSVLATSRYPYFAEYLRRAFGYRPLVTRPHIEAYFDPGFRTGSDVATLVDGWRDAGIRVIYAATWYEFDYARLIDICHRSGIAVYAWFALPMVTRQFWEDHPQWRAARTGWRYPTNLDVPDARRAAFDWARTIVEHHDWDGVNLAELNYEVPGDISRAANVTAWHRELLAMLAAKDLDVIVTTFDSVAAPTLRETHGVDLAAISGLMRNFPFTLQLEDSFEYWATPPDRYLRFARAVAGLVPDRRRLMWDVNVVTDRDVERTDLPSALATGTEFLQLLRAAAANGGRVAVYSESTVAPHDWEFAAAALASGVRVSGEAQGVRVHAPQTIALRETASGEWRLVPRGDHLIPSPKAGNAAKGIRLTALSCELLDWRAKPGGARLTYDSPGRCAMAWDKTPAQIRVDGNLWAAGTFPRGRHDVDVEAP
jgi:hypothetical protein